MSLPNHEQKILNGNSGSVIPPLLSKSPPPQMPSPPASSCSLNENDSSSLNDDSINLNKQEDLPSLELNAYSNTYLSFNDLKRTESIQLNDQEQELTNQLENESENILIADDKIDFNDDDIWDPFNSNIDKTNSNENEIENLNTGAFSFNHNDNTNLNDDQDNSNWAKFDAFDSFDNIKNNPEEITHFDDSEKNAKQHEEQKICSNNQENKNEDTNEANDNGDDDFADFVENPTIFIEPAILPPSVIPKQEKIDDQSTNKVPHQQDTQNIENSINIVNIDYDYLVEKLFESYLSESQNQLFNFKNNIKNANKVYKEEENDLNDSEYLIDCDETWQQLKTYTSVTDASISLQFKWLLSDLENNYLNSLNLDRVYNSVTNSNQNNILTPSIISNSSTSVSNEILKPAKLNTKDQQHKENKSSPSKIETPATQKNQAFETKNLPSPKTLITSPALELDLSYFESKLESLKNDPSPPKSLSSEDFISSFQSTSTTTNNNKQSTRNTTAVTNNSKVYLDKLLQDIFINTNNGKNNESNILDSNNKPASSPNLAKKEEDILADKKSLSSSSSSSSSTNINELAIQLQPHKLEQQQYLEMVHTNQNNDKKKLETVSSKMPNLQYNKSKTNMFSKLKISKDK